MTHYIAFLRAINITGRFVRMEVLRQLFESMGFTHVTTFIQSGNVLFESSDVDVKTLESLIEDRLREALGYPVAAFLRSGAELVEIARYVPFQDDEVNAESVLFIVFLKDEPSRQLKQRLLAYSSSIDTLHVYKRQVFWRWRNELGASTFSNARIEKVLGAQATLRNATTVQKIAAKYRLHG